MRHVDETAKRTPHRDPIREQIIRHFTAECFLSFEDVRAEDVALFDAFAAGDPSFAFPGGESFAHQEVRVEDALKGIERDALPALVVCHGMVIRAALSSRTGHWEPQAQRVPNGAIILLDAPHEIRVPSSPSAATEAS